MDFNFRFDKSMYSEMMEIFQNRIRMNAKKDRRKNLLYILCISMISIIFIGMDHTLLAISWAVVSIFYFVYSMLGNRLGINFALMSKHKKNILLSMYTGSITEEGVIFHNGDMIVKLGWTQIDNVYVSKDFIFLMGSEDTVLQSIPRFGLIDSDFQVILSKIAQQYYPLKLIELDK